MNFPKELFILVKQSPDVMTLLTCFALASMAWTEEQDRSFCSKKHISI